MPAALRAIAALSRAGVFEAQHEWLDQASARADAWEERSLDFFTVVVPRRLDALNHPDDRRLTCSSYESHETRQKHDLRSMRQVMSFQVHLA